MRSFTLIVIILLAALALVATATQAQTPGPCSPCNVLAGGQLSISVARGSPVTVQWDFPIEQNGKIIGFRVRRGQTPAGVYNILADMIGPRLRTFQFPLTVESHIIMSSIYQTLGTRLQAIRCGGISVQGWSDDMNYSGGSAGPSAGPPAIDVAWQFSSGPQEIYQASRYGAFTYTLYGLQQQTAYLLRLHFAETVYSLEGQRLMDVFVNGRQMLRSFDIILECAAINRAIARQYFAMARADGTILIEFRAVTGSAGMPKVCGIELYSVANSYQRESPGSNQAVAEIAP